MRLYFIKKTGVIRSTWLSVQFQVTIIS